MTTIRVLMPNSTGLVYVTGPTTLTGIGAPYTKLRVLSILDNLNITFVPTIHTTECTDDGLCSGDLHDLQTGKGDYARPRPLNVLNNIGTNLTTVAVAWEYECFLAYKKILKLNVDYSTFFDFIYSFDWYFWIIFFTLFGLISIILCSIIKLNSPSIKLTSILWGQFESIVGQNYNTISDLTKRSFLIWFMFSILIIGIILSCSLQTGLISNVDYIKLDTLSDVIRYNYKPIISTVTSCIPMLRNNLSPIAQQISSQTEVIKYKSATHFYQFCKQEKTVTIADIITFESVKHSGCSVNEEDENRNPFSRSDHLLYNSIAMYMINRNSLPVINRIIIRRAYTAFENNFIRNSDMVKIVNKYFGDTKARLSCIDAKVENQESVSPITLSYLLIPFAILALGYLLGFFSLFIKYQPRNENSARLSRFFSVSTPDRILNNEQNLTRVNCD